MSNRAKAIEKPLYPAAEAGGVYGLISKARPRGVSPRGDTSEIEKLISDTELSQKETEELQRMIVIRSGGRYKLESWQLRSLLKSS